MTSLVLTWLGYQQISQYAIYKMIAPQLVSFHMDSHLYKGKGKRNMSGACPKSMALPT